MKSWAIALPTLLITACSAPPIAAPVPADSAVEDAVLTDDSPTAPLDEAPPEFYPPPGSNEMLREALSVAEGLEVII